MSGPSLKAESASLRRSSERRAMRSGAPFQGSDGGRSPRRRRAPNQCARAISRFVQKASSPSLSCVIQLSLRCIIQPMTRESRPNVRRRPEPNDGDALDLIETEMAVLTRMLERLQRRSTIHKDLDRASYLIA